MKKSDKKERILTEAELRRKEKFEKIKDDLEKNGYTTRNLTMDIVSANIYALLIMLPFVILFILLYYWVNGSLIEKISMYNLHSLYKLYFVMLIFIVLIVIHELIHGFIWGCFSQNKFKSIEFGIIWSALTAYCTCSEPLKKWQYILGVAMPTLLLGFLPAIISVFTANTLLLFVSIMMLTSGGADFCIIIKLLIHKSNKHTIYLDHPYECGLVAFEKAEK